MTKYEKRFSQFIHNSYSGARLLKDHSLTEYGIWRVRGEDPNADMGGFHHEPELGIFEGLLEDVIRYAIRLPGWYTWGAGGSIEPIKNKKIIKITKETLKELDSKRKEIESLELDISVLEKKIKELKEKIGE